MIHQLFYPYELNELLLTLKIQIFAKKNQGLCPWNPLGGHTPQPPREGQQSLTQPHVVWGRGAMASELESREANATLDSCSPP